MSWNTLGATSKAANELREAMGGDDLVVFALEQILGCHVVAYVKTTEGGHADGLGIDRVLTALVEGDDSVRRRNVEEKVISYTNDMDFFAESRMELNGVNIKVGWAFDTEKETDILVQIYKDSHVRAWLFKPLRAWLLENRDRYPEVRGRQVDEYLTFGRKVPQDDILQFELGHCDPLADIPVPDAYDSPGWLRYWNALGEQSKVLARIASN